MYLFNLLGKKIVVLENQVLLPALNDSSNSTLESYFANYDDFDDLENDVESGTSPAQLEPSTFRMFCSTPSNPTDDVNLGLFIYKYI